MIPCSVQRYKQKFTVVSQERRVRVGRGATAAPMLFADKRALETNLQA